MKATITVYAKGEANPFIANPPLGLGPNLTPATMGAKAIWRSFLAVVYAVLGAGIASRKEQRPKLWASVGAAQAVVTAATVVNGNTLTLNGKAMTAAQYRATGTLTMATAIAGNTATINGIVFTGATGAVNPGDATFSVDTSNTAAAASLATQVNAYNGPGTLGVGARSAVAVVTVYALAEGTAGNSIPLVGTATTITASGATLASGAAAANNGFDFVGNNATTAASIAANMALSTDALISQALVGNAKSIVVTCASVAVGDQVNLRGDVLTAGAALTDSSGARVTSSPINAWSQGGGTDTLAATSLVNCINAHPRLRELYYADSSSGVVTIHERSPSNGNGSFCTTSNGTRLGVTGQAANTAVAAGIFGANGVLLVESLEPGQSGNQATIASSGGTLAITGSLTRLAGGTTVQTTF